MPSRARRRTRSRTSRQQPKDVSDLSARALATRNRLLVAARKVFEVDGFLNARITDISKKAKVAHGTFYVYFDSKETILKEVVRQVHQELLRPLDTLPRDAMPVIEGINRHYISVYRENAKLLVEWERVAWINDEFESLQQELRNGYVEWSTVGIAALQKSGYADPSLDAGLAARALSAMVSQFCYQWFSQNLAYDFEMVIEEITCLATNAIKLRPLD
jgi:AcrR family transcriptional regulator